MKYIVFLMILLSYNYAGQYSGKHACTDKAYKFATENTLNEVEAERVQDLQYMYPSVTCCCALGILNLFRAKTKDITHNRVNPAMDKLTHALTHQLMASDLKIKELVNLKYINSLYSFYDKEGKEMKAKELDMKAKGDGCVGPIKFRILKKKDKMRKSAEREGILIEILSTVHKWKKVLNLHVEKNMKEMVE